MDVETLAVNEISTLMAECPHLVPTITTNDKTPFTDGHVDMYDGLSRAKSGWVGRIPVQVKGRRTNARGRFNTTFKISRADLAAFQQQGGVVFFLVYVDPKSGRRHPLFRVLSPFGIRDILDASPEGGADIAVELSPLPRDSASIERILYIALKSQEQRLSVGFDPSLINEGTSISIYVVDPPSFDAPLTLSSETGDSVLVLNTSNGMALPMPGELTFFPPSYLPRETKATVAAGDVTFNRPTVQQIGDRSFEVTLSRGLSVVTTGSDGEQSTTVTLSPVGNLVERVKDISFYLELTGGRSLSIDGKSTQFKFADDPDDARLREHLGTLQKVVAVFDTLHIDPNLVELADITPEQVRALLHMHHSLVEGKHLNAANGQPGLLFQPIAQWQVALLVLPADEPGSWAYGDPFAPEHQHRYRVHRKNLDGTLEPCAATAFDILGDEFPKVLNLHLSDITAPYDVIADLPDTITLANMRVLALIKAADAITQRSVAFLDAAAALNEWLISVDGEQEHHLINRWQILHRRDALGSEQRAAIRGLRRSVAIAGHPRADEVDALCAILLGDAEDTAQALARLTENELAQVKDYPIWALVADR